MPLDVYYNENDLLAAQHLRTLIAAGELPYGVVDTRDIRDVKPSNLDGFAQCHFFAGVGIWAKALQIAGWRHDEPVWTGSCPCQPLSAAGKGLGFEDERHLWPDWHWLIQQCRPETIFGEQVASADGLKWADLVQTDLEATDYAAGPVDTCAAGFGAYHIRQRLYFAATDELVAHTASQQRRLADGQEWQSMLEAIWRGAAVGVEHANGPRSAAWLPKALVGQSRNTDVHDNGSRGLSGPNQRQSEAGRLDNDSSIGRVARWNGNHTSNVRQQLDTNGTNSRLGHPASPRPLSSAQPRIRRFEEGTGPRDAEPERSGGDAGGISDSNSRERYRIAGSQGRISNRSTPGWIQGDGQPERSVKDGGLADDNSDGTQRRAGDNKEAPRFSIAECGSENRTDVFERGGSNYDKLRELRSDGVSGHITCTSPPDIYGAPADWLFCRDGKWRPVGPGTFPLANATPGRVGALRAYGNGLDLGQATAFVHAFMERSLDIGHEPAGDLFEWGT